MQRKNAEVVRMALRQFLEVPSNEGRPADRVRELLGSVASGEPDLAERRVSPSPTDREPFGG